MPFVPILRSISTWDSLLEDRVQLTVIDPDSPEAKQADGMLGGYVVLGGNTYRVDPIETALILDAVRKNRGP